VIKEFGVCEIFEKLETLVDHYKTDFSLRISFECDDPELKIQAMEMREKAEIIISALPQENRVVLKVTDNGEGIPPEISDEIFMPFFTTRRKGTGVGRSYSRQVMAMNNGRIEFDSQPGRTQFRLLY
jgi:signal transduction histidine kinase